MSQFGKSPCFFVGFVTEFSVIYPYFVRLGALAEIHVATAIVPMSRGQRVVVRSRRGLQWATVTGEVANHEDGGSPDSDVKILRPVNESDDLLIARLDRDKRQAVESCREKLKAVGSRSILLDVDQTLSGDTLIMHFLGDIDAAGADVVQDVAELYEKVVQTEQVASGLNRGCGDACESGGCGTGNCGSGNCGSGNCGSCSH